MATLAPLAPPQTYPVAVPATTEAEAKRKTAALGRIAASLNLESLELIAKASAKPGADAKLKTYAAFL